jgi:hypothetical protein
MQQLMRMLLGLLLWGIQGERLFRSMSVPVTEFESE